jgi:D-alanyl-D-alanine carboxypeptidase/D-alanyl-D-alanine-endopeptidase (penicillin-binding protein 4)
MNTRKAALIAALLAALSSAWGDSIADLRQAVTSCFAKASDAIAAAEVYSISTGEVLYSRDCHRPLIPASNTKLVTSATALEMLGADYRFHTAVYGNMETGIGGTVDGDLILRGDADPGLSNAYLATLANQLWKAGIRRVSGKVLATGPVGSGDVNFTAAQTAEAFYKRLGEVGILVGGDWGAIKTVPHGALKLVGHESRPIKETIRLMNKPSDNQIANSLMRTLIVKVGAQKERPLSFVAHFWQQRGLDVTGVCLYDGSGLSRGNRVTPAFLIGLLEYMHDESAHAEAFAASLPIAGCDGTLAHRMRDTCAESNVQAKTGWLTGVCCLSGYAETRDGEPLAFSLMFNGFDCDANVFRRLQDQVCVKLTGFKR